MTQKYPGWFLFLNGGNRFIISLLFPSPKCWVRTPCQAALKCWKVKDNGKTRMCPSSQQESLSVKQKNYLSVNSLLKLASIQRELFEQHNKGSYIKFLMVCHVPLSIINRELSSVYFSVLMSKCFQLKMMSENYESSCGTRCSGRWMAWGSSSSRCPLLLQWQQELLGGKTLLILILVTTCCFEKYGCKRAWFMLPQVPTWSYKPCLHRHICPLRPRPEATAEWLWEEFHTRVGLRCLLWRGF